MFTLKRGDIQRLAEATKLPHETVRRYVHGGDVRASAAKAIDAAYSKIKPVRSKRQRTKRAATNRREFGGTVGGSKGVASPDKKAATT